MEIKVLVPSNRKCPASVDWNDDFTKATLSFGDLGTPGTDVEVEFTVEQLGELGVVAVEAEIAGNEARAKKKRNPTFSGNGHIGRC